MSPTITKICPQCNKEFYGRNDRIYCSRSCRNKANPCEFTDEHRVNLSKSLKGLNAGINNPAYGKFGEDSWTYGTKRTDECKKRLSELKKGKYVGKVNWNWKGGKSFELYPREFSNELKTKIRKRDNFTCQLCGENGYDVHHIDYDKHNCSEENLITLCRKCHPRTNHNREGWTLIFNALRSVLILRTIQNGIKV